jgi:hypothetical protein
VARVWPGSVSVSHEGPGALPRQCSYRKRPASNRRVALEPRLPTRRVPCGCPCPRRRETMVRRCIQCRSARARPSKGGRSAACRFELKRAATVAPADGYAAVAGDIVRHVLRVDREGGFGDTSRNWVVSRTMYGPSRDRSAAAGCMVTSGLECPLDARRSGTPRNRLCRPSVPCLQTRGRFGVRCR